jgi:predicted solute-binding protein
MTDRVKLETAIEREVHNLVFKISEHVYDFVNLYVRKNNLPIDHDQMKAILQIVKMGVQDGELKQIDFFHRAIKDALERELGTADEVPFTKTELLNTNQKEERITFTSR